MELLQQNPFTTIKANDLNDSEINQQWVDIKGTGFLDLFCPTNMMPQYVLGGKGSGKTHLIRYFSYKSQMDRHKGNPLSGIVEDGYFGIYFLASGLNGSRFEHLPIERGARNAIFEYSFELWFAGITLEAILELQEVDSNLIRDEKSFCTDLCKLFTRDIDSDEEFSTIEKVKEYIVKLSNLVDLEVNNAFFKDSLDIEILTNRGQLIFGVPQLLTKHSDVFKDVTFLYLIDELENISEDQQKYINTLVREKQLPTSFRVGARRHGIKTWETLGAGESNREGHEFAKINLDSVFVDDKKYEEFAVDLIINRLIGANLLHKNLLPNDGTKQSNEARKDYLSALFEEVDIPKLITGANKNKEKNDPILKSFKSRLEKSKPKINAEEIITELSFGSDLVLEKIAINIFCQHWSKNQTTLKAEDLIEVAKNTRNSIEEYISAENVDKNSLVYKKLDKYINNYTASALRGISQNNLDQYHGLNNLLIITKGFPRHILTVLRHAYRAEVFQGKTPFTNNEKMSLKSQKLALKQSSDWFHEDCISEGKLGTEVGIALGRLCEILRIEMYCDKPVECSASGFTLDKNQLSQNSKAILEWAELIRVIVPSGQPRQEKNSQRLIAKYQVNGLLCPKWGLSLARRGALSFSPEDIDAILDASKETQYTEFKNKFQSSRNAPFKLQTNDKTPKQEKPAKQDKTAKKDDTGNFQMGLDI